MSGSRDAQSDSQVSHVAPDATVVAVELAGIAVALVLVTMETLGSLVRLRADGVFGVQDLGGRFELYNDQTLLIWFSSSGTN